MVQMGGCYLYNALHRHDINQGLNTHTFLQEIMIMIDQLIEIFDDGSGS